MLQLDNLDKKFVVELSKLKNEPDFMLQIRLKALESFHQLPWPSFGPDLSQVKNSSIQPYAEPKFSSPKSNTSSSMLTRQNLAGFEEQHESLPTCESLNTEYEEQGVIFCSTDSAVQNHPELVEEYFGTLVKFDDNKFAALNTALWSGGTFIYLPPNIKIEQPFHTYFRLDQPNSGQFERTLIIADKASAGHYLEGCTANTQSPYNLHAAVVEVFLKDQSTFQYSTLQNWSHQVYNLVTKRATQGHKSNLVWLDCNFGSKVSMKYPTVLMTGNEAKAEVYSLASASVNQIQDNGANIKISGQNCQAQVISQSISEKGGQNIFRGNIRIEAKANNSKAHLECNNLILDNISLAESIPKLSSQNDQSDITHEASLTKLNQEALIYLQSRGFSSSDAIKLLKQGFARPILEQLPLEYQIEVEKMGLC